MIIKLGHFIYRLTPFHSLRKLYFETYARMVSERQVVAELEGIRYHLELGETIDLALYLGKFEPRVVAAIKEYCQPGMTVLDIGANIGAHALRCGGQLEKKAESLLSSQHFLPIQNSRETWH